MRASFVSQWSNFDPAWCSTRFVLLEDLGGFEVPRYHPDRRASIARPATWASCFPRDLTGAASGKKELWEASVLSFRLRKPNLPGRILASTIPPPSNRSGTMEVAEANSPTEEEEEEEEEGEETVSEPRPHTRSNPEGAEDRALGAQANVGSRSEGEGEAATADGAASAPGAGPKPWQVPASASEVQIRTPRVNCPEKVIICLDLSEEMSVPKLESFHGYRGVEFGHRQLRMHIGHPFTQ